MQKKLIALAVASLVSAPVFAQSQVTIYGIIDQAVSSTNGGKGSVTTLLGSGYTTERLGFKGSEDLGNGMKANFMLELGMNSPNGTLDNPGGGGNQDLFQRTATVGLSGASWGSVNLGRQYTPVFSIQAANDIFRVAGVGSIYALTNDNVTRANNSIRYDSADMSGFSLAAMYALGDTSAALFPSVGTGLGSGADPKDLGRHTGVNLRYGNGPMAIGYGYGRQEAFFAAAGTSTVRQTTNALAGSYDFKVVAINAGWQTNKTDDNPETRDNRVWNLGATMPVAGKDSVKLVYAKYQDRRGGVSAGDANLISLGYVHPMSPRTVLYGTYAKLTNQSNAKVSLFGGAQATGVAGYDPTGLQIGIQHAF